MLVNCLPSQGACPTRFPRFSPRYRARATSLQPYAPKFYRVPSHFTVTPHPDNDDYQISRGAKLASPSPNTMNSFGVIEVASTKTKNAPGWAYVPDVGPSPAAAALQPTNRKRAARNQSVLSASDLSARQEAKIRKDLEALDRDIHKDAVIPIPLKGGASRTQKHTPNVRKILQSQKTFANHLDDYQALLALAETNPAAAAALMNAGAPPKPAAAATSSSSARNSNSPAPTSSSGGGGKGDGTAPAPTSKRSAAMAKRAALATANEKKEKEAAAKKAAAAAKAKAKADAEAAEAEAARKSADQDVEMTDAPETTGDGEAAAPGPSQHTAAPGVQPPVQPTPPPAPPPPPQIYPPDGTILPPYKRPPPPKHEGDNDPLLVSYVPRFPTDDELRALLTAPPLNYLEARAVWGEEETRYPQRSFCDVCGYWGRVRCMKCGAKACALDCLNAHKEECVTRYGL